MYKVLAVLLILLLCPTGYSIAFQGGLEQRVTELSQQIEKEMAGTQKKTIAVVEFTDLRGCVTDFGRYLSEVLVTRLYQTKKFRVIERQLLSKIITEQKLSLTGVIDPASAKQLGKLLGVDAIASGTVSDLSQSLNVNARLISTETGEIFAVATTEIFKDESVIKLLGSSPCSKLGSSEVSGDPSIQNSGQKKESNGFTFDLRRCRMSSTTITCELMITNNDEDRTLVIGNVIIHTPAVQRSRLFDNLGNEYYGEQHRLGNQFGIEAAAILISGIPTRAAITFEQVHQEAAKVTVFEILCRSTKGPFVVQFRNVPISK